MRQLFSARGAALVATLAVAALACSGLARATDWPQQHSDIPGEKAVRFGQLPNGMRYAIMRNATPKGAVSMWLDIGAGSLQESDAQQGLAHFLEHMAFRGSRHVPEAEVWPGLQRLGMSIGADANAATGQFNTVYQFNFPHNDAATIDTGLMRLRDVASELTLAQTAMDAERGVVLSEERLRDTPAYRGTKQFVQQLYPGDVVNKRWPIGQTDVLRNAPVSLIRDFYDAFYRPERATLIVVGEIDPDAIEAKVKTLFGDWKPTGPAGHDPARPTPGRRAPQAQLFVEPGAPSSLTLAFVLPGAPDTVAREVDDFAKLLALQIFQARLAEVANGQDHLFAEITPRGSRDFPGSALWYMETQIRPQDWHLALDAAIRVARQMETYGVTADELARAEAGVRAMLQAGVANADTRQTRDLAQAIESNVVTNEIFDSPAQTLAIAEKAFKSLDPAKMRAAIAEMMHDHGPLVFVSSPTPIEGGQAALTAALDAAMKAQLTPPAAEARVTWPYENFGTPGQVAERKTLDDLQTTFVRFANGVRLTVRPSSLQTGQVIVNVRIGNGKLDLPADRATAAWALDDQGLFLGGTKALSFEDMARALPGRVLQDREGLGDDGIRLRGTTRPEDLATQLQVFAAFVSAPGWRPGALERARTLELTKARAAATSPSELFERVRACRLFSQDPRWCKPTVTALAAVKPDALKDLLAPSLATAPLEVIIAGDVKLDTAIEAVAKTFGALPKRGEATSSLARGTEVHFPTAGGAPVEIHHQGRADQGLAAVAWHTTDLFHAKEMWALNVLSSVISTRLLDRLRISEGVTYSPGVRSYGSNVAPNQGYLYAETELPPDKMPLFFAATRDIAADLRAHPVAADEIERARKPLVDELIAEQQSNAYWVNALIGAQDDPRRVAVIGGEIPGLEAVTAADLQEVANRYLGDGKEWKLEITPGATAERH
ncbi:MAG TPA: insulinase family protein [Xanthobacteraceae bacterium]|nr:insulinase family protein [Xanthobacteraceae bacterium]